MKTVAKKKWVEALRSGKYKKGTGALHRKTRYCCLGVFLEEVCKTQGTWEVVNAGLYRWVPKNNRDYWESDTLPDAISNKYGIHKEDIDELIAMNDGCCNLHGNIVGKKSFKKIADWIEANM